MPYQGPGARHTVEAVTKECEHGDVIEEEGFVGTAFNVDQPDRFTRPEDVPTIGVGDECEMQLGGVHEAPATELSLVEDAEVGDDVYIRIADNVLGLAADALGTLTTASLVTGVVGSNNAIHWAAQDTGVAGNSVRVRILNPGTNSASLTVDSDGRDVIVSLATDGAAAATSTATQVIAAVNEHDGASQLVVASNEGASSGAGIPAIVSLTALTGGVANGLKTGWRKVGKVTEIDLSRTPAVLRINGDGPALAQVAG